MGTGELEAYLHGEPRAERVGQEREKATSARQVVGRATRVSATDRTAGGSRMHQRRRRVPVEPRVAHERPCDAQESLGGLEIAMCEREQ